MPHWETVGSYFFPVTSVKKFCTFADNFIGGRLSQSWISSIFLTSFYISFQHGKGLSITSVKLNELFEEYAEIVKVLTNKETGFVT